MEFEILLVSNDSEYIACMRAVRNRLKNINIYYEKNGCNALERAARSVIDLFIIDTRIDDCTGIQLAHKLRSKDSHKLTSIIFFSTDYDLSLSAFTKTHCYQYMIKPIDMHSLVLDIITLSNPKLRDYTDIVKFSEGKFHLRINMYDIYFFVADGRKSIMHTKHKVFSIPMPFKDIAAMLEPYGFIMSHRSFIINPSNVQSFDRSYGHGHLTFHNYEYKADVSKNNLERVLELFEN